MSPRLVDGTCDFALPTASERYSTRWCNASGNALVSARAARTDAAAAKRPLRTKYCHKRSVFSSVVGSRERKASRYDVRVCSVLVLISTWRRDV